MANAQRSIKIIQLDRYTVTFQPDVDGAKQGQPLGANTGDIITWNNTTDNDLELQVLSIQTTPPGPPAPVPQLFQNIKLKPGSASDPIFNVTQLSGTTITYCCKNPTKQQHSIVIGPVPRPKGGGGPRPKGGGGGPRPKGGGGGPRPKGGGGGPRPKGGGGGPRPKGGGGGPRPKGGGPRPK